MTETVQLIITTGEVLPGHYVKQFYWKGPRTGILRVHRFLARDFGKGEKRFTIGGYPLRLVERDDYTGDYLYARTDGLLTLSWLYHVLYRLLLRVAGGFYGRCIYTLMVWDLADVPQNEIPSWRHVGRKRR